MTQFDKIKQDINACESPMEMVGYLTGIQVAATLYCKKNCPEEIIVENGKNDLSIYGMASYLESEAKE